ncbi:translation elongation factor Ts [Candidatus Gracilibacteria bacterium]|nr:translation elongation factor Ts [Candidatus Gracilibacteria bacterium]
MSVEIEQIKELREATGVSMMVCKKALQESDGDFEKAVEFLRKRGVAKAADRSGRSTTEGAVVVRAEGGKTAMVSLQSETDFVSKSDEFLSFAKGIADEFLSGKASSKEDIDLVDAGTRLGENLKIGDFTLFEGGTIGEYIHSNRKIGVLVSLEGGNVDLAKDIAMHVAAMNPAVLSPDEISEELVAKEKGIWAEQLKNEGKPEEIIDKIMMGKEKKFREDSALLKQDFVKNPDQTIEQLLEAAGATVKESARFAV